MQNASSATFLVTGAAGFVGSHLVKQLLEQNYKVKATVRSLADKTRYSFLYDLVQEKAHNLEVVEGNLTDKACWPSAVEGCQGIYHVATPFSGSEDEMIRVPVMGMMNILEAALEKGVSKVVFTSAAMLIGDGKQHEKVTYTEDDWIGTAAVGAYSIGKIRAHEAAEEFCRKHAGKIKVAAVIPPLIVGPVLSNDAMSSKLLVGNALEGAFPRISEVRIAIVDVRDVADMHIRLMNSDFTNARRYLCTAGLVSIEEVMDVLDKNFSALGYKIPTQSVAKKDVPTNTDNLLVDILLAGETGYSNQRGIQELKMKYHSVSDTIVETARSLIDKGLVSK